jgi:hypothetical protein
VLAATIGMLVPLREMKWAIQERQDYEREVRERAGQWIEAHSDPADVVLVTAHSSVGYLGYYTRRRVIDSKGTVTPETLAFWGNDHRSPDLDIADAFHPSFCVVHPDERADIERAAEAAGRSWSDDYELVETFPWKQASAGYEIYRCRRCRRR